MKKGVPNFTKEKELLTIGESSFHSNIGHPLQLAYTSLIICTKGYAVVSVNFKNYLLKANDVLVLAEDYLTIIQRVSNDFNAFYCLVDKTLAAEIAYDLPNQLFLYLNKYPFARPRDLEISLLYGWIDAIKHIKNSGTPHQHIMYRNHLQNFFLKMAATVSFEDLNLEKQYSRKEMLSWNFWELIGKYSNKERNVAFYAEKLHITPYYLSQITKDFLNDSPKGLIDRQVVLEIKTLLRTTEKSIKEIAEILNFKDTSYLARYFKRQTGITLKAYKK